MFDYMNKQILSQQLVGYGLDATEADLYLFLLENGPQTALQLSRSLSIDRSKIYRSVEKLLQLNFLEQSHAAWGKKLQAASPQNITLLLQKEEERLQQRKDALPELIKELGSIPANVRREFEVKYYHGSDGLRQMLWNQLSAKKEIVAFSLKNRNDIVGKPYAEKVRAEQVARRITFYEVENETDQGDYWYTGVPKWKNYYRSRHIPVKTLRIKQHIAIFNNTVSIINWLDKEEVGVEIINAAYADMQRQLFWKFWEIAGATHAFPQI
jgi:sugar-specific transcriptional regulator TrmB